ncbi:sulfatase [Echinicola strongylocentroti]|uniref:Sulfatase n=1 Tax=Echinicola strongylocentroti TaxID=1795355 RepID=A0A2Z4IGN2_9BACT|nr:arylsulfatase [Echinicola strongylocentroti]AWW29603.1 sulfatase [Echinicola strongylocentroti]
MESLCYDTYKSLLAILLSLTIGSCSSKLPDPKRPNVIIILTDDQGYGDLSCHGNEYIQTPQLDKLYNESVRFTDFHVDPTCAPTRAALMTGKYSHGAGVWHTIAGGNHLRAKEMTMADVFKSSGYQTALFGKWHLGSNYPYRPMDRGFDEWIGQGDGGTGTTDDWFDNDRVNDHYWHNGERVQIDGFAPDVFYNAAIDFIKKKKNTDAPFFVYLPTYLPHAPHTLPDTLLADNSSPDVSTHVSYFYSGIERIDANIGRLREMLEETGQADDTILIFMSDNGGTAGVPLFNAGMRGHKGQVYEGGHRVPFFLHWPNGQIRHGSDVKDLTAHIDLFPTLLDLCQIDLEKQPSFDGRSFKEQLFIPEKPLSDRTVFVETQRTITSKKWVNTVGMNGKWRLVNNQELYDISKDPAQTNNTIADHPEIVKTIQDDHVNYWKNVSPGDRDKPVYIVGHEADPETYLTSSDWHLSKTPWTHAQVASGPSNIGTWEINVSRKGIYRFEVRRWPKEANAPISGIPRFHKTIDAWDKNGGIDKLIYGDQMKPLPVKTIQLEVGGYTEAKAVDSKDTSLTFDVELIKGRATVKAIMLDNENQVLAGAYYLYITPYL